MAFKTLQLVPEKPPTWWQGLLVGATSLAGAVVARLAVLPIVHHGAPFLTFFPAVMAASVWGGRLGGLFVLAAAPLAVLIERGFTVQNPSFEAGAVEVFLLAGGLMVWLGDALSRSVREVYAARGRDAEAQLQAVIRELGHRARNGFAVVMALTDQSARSATSVEDYRNRLLARLSALSASQDLITRARGAPVSLRDLFRGILDPFDLDRFAWPPLDHDCQVDPETALALALVFHELATDAPWVRSPPGRSGPRKADRPVRRLRSRAPEQDCFGPPFNRSAARRKSTLTLTACAAPSNSGLSTASGTAWAALPRRRSGSPRSSATIPSAAV